MSKSISIAPNNPIIGGLNLAVSSTRPNVCEELQCADLTATYTDTKATTTYTVAPKLGGYAAYPFNGGTLLPSCNSTNTNCVMFLESCFCMYALSTPKVVGIILGVIFVVMHNWTTPTAGRVIELLCVTV